MAVIEEIIRLEENGGLSFGNYSVREKKKVLDFDVNGNLFKVKTYKDITKLEKDGGLVFESIPGSAVHNFLQDGKEVSFTVEAPEDLQITLELEPGKEYKLFVNSVNIGKFKTNLSGKLSFGLEVEKEPSKVKIEKA